MTRLIITLFLVLGYMHTIAQNSVRVTLNITPPYSTSLTDYRPSPSGPGKMIVTVQNLSNSLQRVYLRAQIKGNDNGIQIYTAPDYVTPTPIVLNPMEARQLFPNEIMDIYDPNRLVYIGTDQREIRNSDRVPEGAYTICVRAYDHTPGRTQIPLSSAEPSGCTIIYMRETEPPMLVQPFQDAEVPAFQPQNVIFSWTQPASTDPTDRYKLRIVEMFEGDGRRIDPNVIYEASGSPIFDQEVVGNTYIYGPADHALVPGRRYAWAVTALDKNGKSYFRNNGRSEVRAFIYTEKNNIINLQANNIPISPPKSKKSSGKAASTRKVVFVKDAQIRDLTLNTFKGKLTWAFRKSEAGYVPTPPPAAEKEPAFGQGSGKNMIEFAAFENSISTTINKSVTGNSANLPKQNNKGKVTELVVNQGDNSALYALGGGSTVFKEVVAGQIKVDPKKIDGYQRIMQQDRIISLADDKHYPLSQTKVSLYLRKKSKVGSPAHVSTMIFFLNNEPPTEILLGQTTTNAAGEFALNYFDEIPDGFDAYLKIDNNRFEFADYDIPLVPNENGTYDFGELLGLAKTYRLRVKIVNEEGNQMDLATVRLERPKGFYSASTTNENMIHEVMKDSISGQPAEVVAIGGKSGSFWPRLFYSDGFSDSYTVIIEGKDIQKTVYNLNLLNLSGLGVKMSESDQVTLLEKTFKANVPLPTVEGRVLTKNGEMPLPGAIVTVQKKGSRHGETSKGQNGMTSYTVDLSARSATADSLGKFKVENIPVNSEAVEVVVHYKGKRTVHDKDVYLSQRGHREIIDPLFVNAELITVTGQVVDGNGQPLSDATLNWKGGGKAFYSDESGNFIGSQTEGSHILVARKPGFKDTEYPIDIKAASKQAGSSTSQSGKNVNITTWEQAVNKTFATAAVSMTQAKPVSESKPNQNKPAKSGNTQVLGSKQVLSNNLASSVAAQQNFYEVFGDGIASESISSGHVIVMSQFFVKVRVLDLSNGQPIAQARISPEGASKVTITNERGIALVADVPGGNSAVIIKGPEESFYAASKAEIIVDASKDTVSVEVKLKAGAKATGQVLQNGTGVANAEVSVEGMEHISVRADAQGRFTLTGIPVGEYTLVAAKEGMLADNKSQEFKANQSYTLNFNLTDPGFNASSLLGFKMVLLRSRQGSGPNEFVISGELRDLPENSIFKRASATPTVLRFTDKIIVKEGNTIYPKGGELVTDVSEIKLKAFGYLSIKLKNSNGLRVRPSSNGSRTQGEIAGENEIDWQGTFSELTGITLPTTPMSVRFLNAGNNTIAPITSSGTISGTSLGFAGSPDGWKLYGIRLIPDLVGSSIDQQGFNLKGKIKLEGIPLINNQELKVDKLVISKRGEIRDVSININPAPVLTLITWKLKLSGIDINQYGLKLNGDLEVPIPSSDLAKISVRQLGINGEQLTGGSFLVPSQGIDIFGLVKFKTQPGRDFSIQRIAGSTHYRFIGAGTINLPKWIKDQIVLDHFSISTNGDFSVVAKTDFEVDFAGMAKLGITKFGFASNVSQITVGGKFRLNIPMFGAGAEGTLYFRKGHAPRIDELGIYFNLASAIALEAKLKFNENQFAGKGALKLAGIPGVGLDFWYEKKPAGIRVGAQFLANVVIPIGIVKLDGLTGGFDFDFAQNIYSINAGGRITVAPDPYGVVALDPVAVKITSTPGGPIFEGNAGVKVLNSWTVGSATMKLDFNKKQFFIDGEFGAGFSLMKGIDVESKSGVHLELYTGAGSNYWFVAGYTRTRILGIFDSGVTLAAGWNIPKTAHESLSGIPNYALTNGRLYGGYFGTHSSIDIETPRINFLELAEVKLWYKNSGSAEVYANFKSNVYGLKIASEWNVGGTVKVFKLGDVFSADAYLGGAVEGFYNNNDWGIGGHLNGRVNGFIGCDGNCNFVTWTGCFNACLVGCRICPIPCGFKICASASAEASYSKSDGLDISLQLSK